MRCVVITLVVSVLFSMAVAPTWAGRVDADPNMDYRVNPQCGEWMICAASYKGADGLSLARQMVLHLRSKENLPAYIHVYRDETGRKMQKELDERSEKLGIPRKRVRIEDDQYAVLIGGFKDMESAHKVLNDVKKFEAPKLKLANGKVSEDIITVASPTGTPNKGAVSRMALNPFTMSFVTRNPTIERAPVEKQTFDPAWKEFNADESYSLLKCKKPWTLVVKIYQGASFIATDKASESTFLEKLGVGSKKGMDSLSAAYANAHNLAEALHKLKFEAYVLHTKDASVVTIGSFDSREDPKLLETQKAFSKSVSFDLKNAEGKIKDNRVLQSMQLMNPPLAMSVPKP